MGEGSKKAKAPKKIVERIPAGVLAEQIRGLGIDTSVPNNPAVGVVELIAEYLATNTKGFDKGLFRVACGLPAIG